MKRSWIVVLCAMMSSVALAQDPSPKMSTPSAPQNNNAATNAAQQMGSNGGSLLKATLSAGSDPNQAKLSGVSFFAVPEPEPRTLKKHDLVTIIIREESEFSSEGTTDLKRNADLDARITEFVNLKLKNWEIEGGALGAQPPSIAGNSSRNFKGEATVDRTDSMTARITAEIIDVKPNGTLIVQARKKIKTDDEEQQFVLTGVCRALDISIDNTVLSTQIYDLELQKTHKGAVRDATKRGPINRFLDFFGFL